jgi:hypothetical protein
LYVKLFRAQPEGGSIRGAVIGDDQFAVENLKGFVLERFCAFVYIIIAPERGNRRDFYHAFKDILSALPQRISGTFIQLS